MKKLTIENIINYAIENGLKYSVYSKIKDELGFGVARKTMIGLEVHKNMWYWWWANPFCRSSSGELETREELNILFSHRINTKTDFKSEPIFIAKDLEMKILSKTS